MILCRFAMNQYVRSRRRRSVKCLIRQNNVMKAKRRIQQSRKVDHLARKIGSVSCVFHILTVTLVLVCDSVLMFAVVGACVT